MNEGGWSEPAVLIATVKLRAGAESAFDDWKAHHDVVLGTFPGFIGSDILPPAGDAANEWTILLNFRSREDLDRWWQSGERAAILAEGAPLFDGGPREVAQAGGGDRAGGGVTEVIFSRIKPGMEDSYRRWAVRIQAAQARYPGYRGMFLQPADEAGGVWTTIIRFDSAAHLEGWMNAPERAALLRESRGFIEHEQLTRLATSFPGWVPIDPVTGRGPPDWKTALLVLLGLFPIVMIELRFVNPALAAVSLGASPATFVSNALGVAATSFVTMPLLVRWFGWWLFPADGPKHATLTGTLTLCLLFAVEVAVFWRFLPG